MFQKCLQSAADSGINAFPFSSVFLKIILVYLPVNRMISVGIGHNDLIGVAAKCLGIQIYGDIRIQQPQIIEYVRHGSIMGVAAGKDLIFTGGGNIDLRDHTNRLLFWGAAPEKHAKQDTRDHQK